MRASRRRDCSARSAHHKQQPAPRQPNVAILTQVSACLGRMGLEPKEEKRIPEGYSIDITVEWGGETIAIEVDGPSHFMGAGRLVTGSTALKRRQLRRLGWKARAGCCCGGHSSWCELLLWRQVLSVPFWEWGATKTADDRREYLERGLREAEKDAKQAADPSGGGGKRRRCGLCGAEGHNRRKCPRKPRQ